MNFFAQGYQLVNSAAGVFSYSIQECHECDTTQYIFDSNNSKFSCQDGPVGAICDGNSLREKINGSFWVADYETGIYLLEGCPEVENYFHFF